MQFYIILLINNNNALLSEYDAELFKCSAL